MRLESGRLEVHTKLCFGTSFKRPLAASRKSLDDVTVMDHSRWIIRTGSVWNQLRIVFNGEY
jgi:hypothetical protein